MNPQQSNSPGVPGDEDETADARDRDAVTEGGPAVVPGAGSLHPTADGAHETGAGADMGFDAGEASQD